MCERVCVNLHCFIVKLQYAVARKVQAERNKLHIDLFVRHGSQYGSLISVMECLSVKNTAEIMSRWRLNALNILLFPGVCILTR